MMILKAFTAHPSSRGESYLAHGRIAVTIGLMCISAGCMALVHALFPFLFETGASTKIDAINAFLKSHNRR